jgi:trimeric autotransporter adhesin
MSPVSKFSSYGKFKTMAMGNIKPAAPTIGTATDVGTSRAYNNGAATVTFTAPVSNGSNFAVTSYTVTSSPGGFTGSGVSSPVTVTGLQSNVAYTFTVVATNSAGDSPASTASNSITATTVPQAPTVSAVNVGTGRAFNNGAAVVTVSGGATGGKTISSYTATSSPGSFTASSTSPITVTGLASTTAYTFSVTATNANGTSTATVSNSITATTVPQAPTIGTATLTSSTAANVAYTANSNGGSAVTTFTATSSPGARTGTGASPIGITGLTPGTAYTFTVTATNANGTSTASAASNSVTPAYAIGDTGPGGGIVFYDAGSTLSWGRWIEAATGATSPSWTESSYVWASNAFIVPTAIGTGATNTTAMIAADGTAGKAHTVMRAYTGGGRNNWSLSSKDELNQMFIRRALIGGTSYQWSSSSDGGSQFAWAHSFSDGTVQSFNFANTLRARPIRHF